MERRLQQAIDEDFERLVRESPRPRLMNGELAGDSGIFERHEQQQRLVRPVPVALVRNRAAPTLVSPLAQTLVSPHPRYTNKASSCDDSSVNESIEEIFDYLKHKSFESTCENLDKNSANICNHDQTDSFNLSKNMSVGNVSDGFDDDVETIDTSFSPQVTVLGHKQHVNLRNDGNKGVTSTVYNSNDELDTHDTGYGTSHLKDLSVSGDEQVLNHKNINEKTSLGTEHQTELHNEETRLHQSDNTSKHLDDSDHGIHSDHDEDGEHSREHDLEFSGPDETDGGSNVKQNGYSYPYEIECREIGVDEQASSVDTDTEQYQQPCSLYMWIIKPIPATEFICVEGKKHPDEEEFWKSGIITQRLNAKTVITQSGSIYRLEGSIEEADAMYAGFSRETVAAFKTGFPEDWKDVIDDHFNSSLLDRPNISDIEISTSTVDKPLATVKDSSCHGKKKEYILSKWLLKPVGKGICVVGINPEGLLWHSSAIEERLTCKRLITSNGSVCRLKGHMDKLQAKEENIPEAIICKFHTGFPKEWQELIQEHFTSDRSAVLENHDQITKTGEKESKSRNVTSITKNVRGNEHVKSNGKQHPSTLQKRKTPDNSLLTDTSVDSESQLDKTVLTPGGQVVNLSNLERSRTGRILKPPVSWWAGQRFSVTDEGVVITGMTDYASKYLKSMEDDLKKTSRVFGRYRFSKLMDTSISSVSSASTVSSLSSNKIVKTSKKLGAKSVAQSKSNNKSVVASASITKKKSVITPKSGNKSVTTSKLGNKSVVSSKLDNGSQVMSRSNNKSAITSKLNKSSSVMKKSSNKTNSKANNIVEGHKVNSAITDSKKQNGEKQIKGTSNKVTSKSDINHSSSEGTVSVSKNSTLEENKGLSVVSNSLGKDAAVLPKSNKLRRNKCISKEPDTKLDKEIFVLLNEVKETKLRSKAPNRTTCYNSIETRTRSGNRSSDCSKDSFSLDDSKDSSKENKDKVIDSKLTKTKVVADSLTTGRATRASERNRKKQKQTNVDCDTKRKEDKGLKELINLQSNFTEKDASNTGPAFSWNRVTRSTRPQGVKVNFSEYFQNDTPVRPIKRKKLSTIKEADDSVNKSQNQKMLSRGKKSSSGKRKNKKSKAKEQNNLEESKTKQEEEIKQSLSSEKKTSSEKKSVSEQNRTVKPKEVALTAKSGTLKRKIQLKGLLEQQNENYEDNLFDSTPFRHTRKRKRAVLDDIDDNALFEELAKKQGKTRFETPAAADVRSRTGRSVPLASARKTPAYYSKEEELLGSTVKNLDGYVHNLKKRQILLAKRRRKNYTPKSVKKSTTKEDSPQKKLFNEFLHTKKDMAENHKDSDCEDDYYWDEETS